MLAQRANDAIMVFNGEKAASDVFAESFLAEVSSAQLAALAGQLTAQLGPLIGLESIDATGQYQGRIAFRYTRAISRGSITLAPEPDGKIIGLFLSSSEPIDDSAVKIRADIAVLPGRVAVYFGALDGEEPPIFAIAPDEQIAIGSGYKLYVLSALIRSIGKGERAWDDVVPLTTKSLPSGVMQDWPDGSPVTLHTLATMMISISDNTATDQLMQVLGRDAVESELRASGHAMPERTLPMIGALELFALKADSDLAARFAAAGEVEQRSILDALNIRLAGKPERAKAQSWLKPRAIDTLEWFASAHDIRRIMQRISDANDPVALALMGVGKGPLAPMFDGGKGRWRYIGYKGGSEPGVLHFSWLLHDNAGKRSVLTLSWNDPDAPVDMQILQNLSRRILALYPGG